MEEKVELKGIGMFDYNEIVSAYVRNEPVIDSVLEELGENLAYRRKEELDKTLSDPYVDGALRCIADTLKEGIFPVCTKLDSYFDEEKTSILQQLPIEDFSEKCLKEEFLKDYTIDDVEIYTIGNLAANEGAEAITDIVMVTPDKKEAMFHLKEPVEIGKAEMTIAEDDEIPSLIKEMTISQIAKDVKDGNEKSFSADEIERTNFYFNEAIKDVKNFNKKSRSLGIVPKFQKNSNDEIQMDFYFKKAPENNITVNFEGDHGNYTSVLQMLNSSFKKIDTKNKNPKEICDVLDKELKDYKAIRNSVEIKYKENGKVVSKEKVLENLNNSFKPKEKNTNKNTKIQ